MGVNSTRSTLETLIDAQIPGSSPGQAGEFVTRAQLRKLMHDVVTSMQTQSDANTLTTPQEYDTNTTITAFATGGQGSATALTGEINNITVCATAGDSVALPTAKLGLMITVKNSGAASGAVFPATGDSINALDANLSVNLPVGGMLTFSAISSTVWETNEALSLTAPTTQTGELVIKAAANAADYEVIVTNASHGQATTHTLTDPGQATGVITSLTAALTSTQAEIDAVCDNSAKSEAVTTTNAIAASEDKTHFILNSATAFVSTLPAPAEGLEFWFHIGATAPTTTHTVVTNASANIIEGSLSSPEDALGTVACVAAADTISFVANKAVHGDMAHVWSDGTSWFLDGHCFVQDGMTTTQAG